MAPFFLFVLLFQFGFLKFYLILLSLRCLFVFWRETESVRIQMGGQVGDSGRSWDRGNCNQNTLHEKNLFSLKERKSALNTKSMWQGSECGNCVWCSCLPSHVYLENLVCSLMAINFSHFSLKPHAFSGLLIIIYLKLVLLVKFFKFND